MVVCHIPPLQPFAIFSPEAFCEYCSQSKYLEALKYWKQPELVLTACYNRNISV